MASVGWKRGQFRITGHPVSGEMFDAWLASEGRPILREALRNTSLRWCLGNTRARYRLHRATRTAFRPRGAFATAAERQLNRLPVVVRACAIGIQKTGHRQLCTFDDERFLAAVPRGVVQNDFRVLLIRELAGMPQVKSFSGLTERALSAIAVRAEQVLFEVVAKGRQLVDESGRGVIVEVDPDFRWKLNGLDGHYYYAAALDESADLTGTRERRRFIAAVRELLKGQSVHLKRMRPEEIAETAEGFRIRQAVSPDATTMSIRVRRKRQAEEPIFSRSY